MRRDRANRLPMNTFLRKLPQSTAVHFVLIFLAVMLPLLATSDAMQTDEMNHWQFRTFYFISAMSYGHFGDTAQTEHPGVTTVLLGSLAHLTWTHGLGNTPLPMPEYMHILRLPVKIVNALAIALAYIPMRHVFGWRVALLGIAFFATEPFARWYMRLLHIDGMTMTLMLLSFGLMLFAFRTLYTDELDDRPVRWWIVGLSGVAAGMAALTRFSAVYMFGMVGICALLNLWPYRRELTLGRFVRWGGMPVAVFTGALVITWVAFYPAMWTAPQRVWEQTIHGVDNATTPHPVNFFMGQPQQDPGAIFYPVALYFRLTPWVFAGLMLAGVAAARGALRDRARLWLTVLLFAVVYVLIISLQAKKFDRYALTVYPALSLLASVGWLWLAGQIGSRFNIRVVWGNVAYVVVLVGIVAHSLIFVTREYAYVSPLAGGGRYAAAVLLMNSGEGMEGLLYFFERLPEDERCNARFMIPYIKVGEQYIQCAEDINIKYLRDTSLQKNIDYIVHADYIVNHATMPQIEPDTQAALEGLTPIFTYTVHGIVYVEIYDGDTVRAANQITVTDSTLPDDIPAESESS
ncbi:MAG: glycosyltransferase family 39 protein [Chloroflexota bacterium]